MQVEPDQLDRRQAMPVHHPLELRDRGRVHVDPGDPRVRRAPRVRRVGGEHPGRRAAEQAQEQGKHRHEDEGTPK